MFLNAVSHKSTESILSYKPGYNGDQKHCENPAGQGVFVRKYRPTPLSVCLKLWPALGV